MTPEIDEVEGAKSELDLAIELLQEALDGRLDDQGGYPCEITTRFRGYVVVADVDHDDAPVLRVFRARDVVRAYRAAKKLQMEDEDFVDNLVGAFHENYPDEE